MLYDRDSRLHIDDPSTQEFRKAQEEQKARAKITLGHPRWQSVIDVYRDIIIERAGLAPHIEHTSDIPLDEELSENARELEVFITSTSSQQRLPNLQSPLMQALCECIGEKLAQIKGYGFTEWRSIHSVIHEFWPIYEEWFHHLPADEVSKYEADIFQLPPNGHVLELVQRWTLHMDNRYWDGYVERLKSLDTMQSGPGAWLEVKRVTTNGELIRLEPDLAFRGRLAQRIGLIQWLKWMWNLPLASMQYAALQPLGNINTAIEVCKIILSPDSEISTHLYQKVMTIQVVIGILESIDGQLTHWSSDRWIVTERDEEFRGRVEVEANHWREVELPEHLQCLAKIIVETTEDTRLSISSVILTGVYQFELRRDICAAMLRDEVVREVSKHSHIILDLITEILGHSSKAGLLSSSRIVFQNILAEDMAIKVCHKVWNSFTHFIASSDFHWGNLYDGDDGLLAWHMAGTLANLPDTVPKFEAVLESLNPASEGWNFSMDRYFANLRQVVFYLIVGAMASEWLMNGVSERARDATTLFESVWNQAHRWIRWSGNYLQENSVLVAELWARLSSILSPDLVEQQAIKGLELLDELEHVITACNVLAMNYHGPSKTGVLPGTLQSRVREIVDAQLPILIATGHTKAEVIKWYQDVAAKLSSVQT